MNRSTVWHGDGGQPGVNSKPRTKTYSAANGYVYQYQFARHEAKEEGHAYYFAVTQDRRKGFELSLLIPEKAAAEWEVQAQRELTPTERYAVAKMALFAAFDEAETPERIPDPIRVGATQVNAILELLDL